MEAQTREAAARLGGLDILVTSAGVTHPATVWETELADWDRVLGVNLTGTFLCVKAAAPRMIENGFGRIVMLASITATHVWSGRAAYAASKGGVLALAKSCAADLAPHGVTVQRGLPRAHRDSADRDPAHAGHPREGAQPDPHGPLRRSGGGGGRHRLLVLGRRALRDRARAARGRRPHGGLHPVSPSSSR